MPQVPPQRVAGNMHHAQVGGQRRPVRQRGVGGAAQLIEHGGAVPLQGSSSPKAPERSGRARNQAMSGVP